jgi:transposase-like protein
VDETVIQLSGDRYWLYAAVDPDMNKLLYTKLEPTRRNDPIMKFFSELREKHDVNDAVFLVDGAPQLHEACRRHGLDLHYVCYGDRNSVKRVFREVKRRTSSFSNCFSNASQETADEWLRCFAFAWNQLI